MSNLSERNSMNSYLSKGLFRVGFLEILILSYYEIYHPILFILPTPPKAGNKIIPLLSDPKKKNEKLVKASITT